jgi:hypothetical protein
MEQSKRLTKEDMAYKIGRIEACHHATLYWVSARFFFHEPKSDAVKKKQKAGYIIFLFIDKGNDLQVSDF